MNNITIMSTFPYKIWVSSVLHAEWKIQFASLKCRKIEKDQTSYSYVSWKAINQFLKNSLICSEMNLLFYSFTAIVDGVSTAASIRTKETSKRFLEADFIAPISISSISCTKSEKKRLPL